MKPLLILSLLGVLGGCKGRERIVVRGSEPLEVNLMDNPQKWRALTTSHGETLQILQPSEFDDMLKAMRLLAAHADPSLRTDRLTVPISLSQQMLIEAKRQEAREAEYAWAKSVLKELEKRK